MSALAVPSPTSSRTPDLDWVSGLAPIEGRRVLVVGGEPELTRALSSRCEVSAVPDARALPPARWELVLLLGETSPGALERAASHCAPGGRVLVCRGWELGATPPMVSTLRRRRGPLHLLAARYNYRTRWLATLWQPTGG